MMTTESIRAILQSPEEAYLKLFDTLLEAGVHVDPVFFAAVGKDYPEAHSRILLIGKATAGWVDEEYTSLPDSRMSRWERRHKVSDDFLPYHGDRQSAFWRFATKLNGIAREHGPTKNIESDPHSISLISWSNLFKIGAHKKNPDPDLQDKQHKEALALLRAELTAFKPHLVAFVTEPFGDNLIYEALGIVRGDGEGFTTETVGQGEFYYRHWTAGDSPAILWVQHPERKPRTHVDLWLAKAGELLLECDSVRSKH